MAQPKRIHVATLVALSLFSATTIGLRAAQPVVADLKWERTTQSAALVRGPQVIWQFNHGTNATKPFFHPVALPGGPVLTWDKPGDHRWHRALWFSWKFINGVNYWEEDPKTGVADGRTEWQEPQIETRADFSARIVMNLTYHPATNAQPVLTERRVVEISPPEKDGTYHQDWTMTFTTGAQDVLLDRTPPPNKPGSDGPGGYAGLSVRFASNIVDCAAVTTEESATFVSGRYRGKSLAADYAGNFAGREAGIAIVDSTANTNSPSPWYVINSSPMNFFTPAVLCYQPLALKAGEGFQLRYRVIVHPGRWDSARLREAAKQFASPQPGKPN